MRPAGATFWRLGGLSGWQKQTAASDLAVSDRHGLRLAAEPGGPLSLDWKDGSFGGLTLPRGFAFDGHHKLYLLTDHGTIKRYDSETHAFVPFAHFAGAANLAIVGDWLYVAIPGERRVRVLDLTRSVIADVLEVDADDVAAHDGVVYILDAAHGRVYRHAPYEQLELELERADRAGQWSRVTVDREGTLYLLNGAVLERRDPNDPPITDAGEIRDLFDPPLVRLDESGHFRFGNAQPPQSTITARGDFLLYVVDREKKRVEAYTDGGRRLRHSWGACMDWQPCDVAACSDTAFILDEQDQAVYRHTAGREPLKRLFRDETGNRHWSRIACDAGSLFLYTPGAETVQVFDCTGRPRCDRAYKDIKPLFSQSSSGAAGSQPADSGGRAGRPPSFDQNGNPATQQLGNQYLYKKSGQWQSKPLDSKQFRCQWHRIELSLTSFPPGSRISVSTCAHEKEADVNDPLKSHFVDAQTIVAPITGEEKSFDFLVRSGLGQYLTIRLKVESDGFSTPEIDAAKIHYPRESYLEYLPATYSTDDEMRVFLERFLAIFQTEWDDVDRIIDEIEGYFDPDAVPEGAFLDYLAGQWLGLPLEGTWNGTQKRRLLSAAPKIYPHRGQLAGLRDFIAVYLANMSGLETEDVRQLEYPVIVEGFREREYLFGDSGDASRLGTGAPLWSATVKRRLQLGVYATEGEAEMVSVGDPEHDVFAQYAHRFRVCVPAAWVRTETDERMIRRALDAEKPAHTQYDLCLISPRFRIGAQSTIGVDTVIGAAPSIRLGCASCSDAAPSLPPAGRLGFDTVLSTDARAAAELVLA